MANLVDNSRTRNLHSATQLAISREQGRREREAQHLKRTLNSKLVQQWKHAAGLALRWSRSKAHYQDQIKVCMQENMSDVDPFDGEKARTGDVVTVNEIEDEDLLCVNPVIDGRLRD